MHAPTGKIAGYDNDILHNMSYCAIYRYLDLIRGVSIIHAIATPGSHGVAPSWPWAAPAEQNQSMWHDLHHNVHTSQIKL